MRPNLAAGSLLLAISACGRGEDPAGLPQPAGAQAAAAGSSAPAPRQEPEPKPTSRRHTQVLDALRRALDLGPAPQTQALLAHAAEAGDEELLLRARAAAQAGRGIEALRLVEEARARHPEDASVYATAAEIYAATDGFDSAAREILLGEKRCGPSAELLRARGIVSISRQGGAARGLGELEAALRADPELPFARRALGQAHLLVGKEAVKAEKLAAALEHARASVGFDPEETDAQRFLAECLAASGDFDGALRTLRALLAKGEPLAAELALMEKRAGVACLLCKERPAALEHFLAARAGGLSDLELATGARLLAEESQTHLDLGVRAYQAGEIETAEREFRAALVYDADSIAAQNHLAVALFRRGVNAEAIPLWTRVLETAEREKLDLPEPVHLNLAEAQLRNGDAGAARRTLEQYLERAPEGRWAELTRAALEGGARQPPAGAGNK